MLERSEKSVWDKPGLGATLSTYDQERWFAAAWGSALAMVGARRGGFTGGLIATLGTVLTVRAAMGRHDFRAARAWLDRALEDCGYGSRRRRRRRCVGGVVPRQRLAVVDANGGARARANGTAITIDIDDDIDD